MHIDVLSLAELSPETYFRENPPLENSLYLIKNDFILPWSEKHYPVVSLHYFSSPSSLTFPDLISIANTEIEPHLPQIQMLKGLSSLRQFLRKLNYPIIDEKVLMEMSPVRVEKPWGQEIWYTGIEKRGVSDIVIENQPISFSDVLKLYPLTILGSDGLPILIKILDPLPEEVYGDLYVEVHEEKQEVYIVTHVDNKAWLNNMGYLKYGLNKKKVESLGGWNFFKAAYKKAVRDYEQLRKKIDDKLDSFRIIDSFGLKQPVPASCLKKWEAQLDSALLAEEKTLRKKMDDFNGLYSLKLGDVVKVDTLVPHSLQHGVRVVEFQTPVYERLILSFAQKVLTQDHWDIDRAIDSMREVYPDPQHLDILRQNKQVRVERVVDFSDFKVIRVTLAPGNELSLSELIVEPWVYCFVFGLSGKPRVKKNFNETILTNEKCLFFPQVLGVAHIQTKIEACFLIAYPLQAS